MFFLDKCFISNDMSCRAGDFIFLSELMWKSQVNKIITVLEKVEGESVQMGRKMKEAFTLKEFWNKQ